MLLGSPVKHVSFPLPYPTAKLSIVLQFISSIRKWKCRLNHDISRKLNGFLWLFSLPDSFSPTRKGFFVCTCNNRGTNYYKWHVFFQFSQHHFSHNFSEHVRIWPSEFPCSGEEIYNLSQLIKLHLFICLSIKQTYCSLSYSLVMYRPDLTFISFFFT